MAKLHYALPALIGALTMTACPGDDGGGANDSTTAGSGDSTGGVDGGPATNTLTNPTTSATSGSDTDPDSSGTDPTTSGTTNPPPTCDPECLPGQSCINGNCIGDPETTGYMCDEWGPGNYNDCVSEGAPGCGAGISCVSDNPADPSAGACAVLGCTDVCDCPEPPEGFDDGLLVCDTLTADMQNGCFFTCAMGQACPSGLVCLGNFFCGYPAVPPTDTYGDCTGGGTCADGGCVVGPDDEGVCVQPCMDVSECPDPPMGATVVCQDATADMNAECFLSCGQLGGTCPAGMECLLDFVCAWPSTPAQEIGYGDCAAPIPTDGCLATENCETNMAGTHSMCTEPGCVDAMMDCPVAADGDAVVSCGDPLMGGADTCYLDCSMGETCPTGQECVGNSYCATPIGVPVFEEDFEGMMFPNMWTLMNVDMLMPDAMGPGAAFTEAWNLFDDSAAGGSQVAASVSWYNPVGVADDWMMSPQITIGANAMLSWEARSIDPTPMFQDGYEVLISTTGTAIADFSTVVFTVAAEPDSYQTHVVDLAAEGFMNQDIHIAFRNITDDGNVLAVDNIAVFE